MNRIRGDFNSLTSDGLVFARLTRASGPLTAGEQVLMQDLEGNSADARVVRVDAGRGLAYLAPDLSTFRQNVLDDVGSIVHASTADATRSFVFAVSGVRRLRTASQATRSLKAVPA